MEHDFLVKIGNLDTLERFIELVHHHETKQLEQLTQQLQQSRTALQAAIARNQPPKGASK